MKDISFKIMLIAFYFSISLIFTSCLKENELNKLIIDYDKSLSEGEKDIQIEKIKVELERINKEIEERFKLQIKLFKEAEEIDNEAVVFAGTIYNSLYSLADDEVKEIEVCDFKNPTIKGLQCIIQGIGKLDEHLKTKVEMLFVEAGYTYEEAKRKESDLRERKDHIDKSVRKLKDEIQEFKKELEDLSHEILSLELDLNQEQSLEY